MAGRPRVTATAADVAESEVLSTSTRGGPGAGHFDRRALRDRLNGKPRHCLAKRSWPLRSGVSPRAKSGAMPWHFFIGSNLGSAVAADDTNVLNGPLYRSMSIAMRNNRSAARESRPKRDTYACFDRLPAPLRRALHESVLDWHPFDCRFWFNTYRRTGTPECEAINRTIAMLRSSDEQEVREFSEQWPEQFGTYPHVAAGATIMRDRHSGSSQ